MPFDISFNVLLCLIIDTLIYIISESITVDLFIGFPNMYWTSLIICMPASFHMERQTLYILH